MRSFKYESMSDLAVPVIDRLKFRLASSWSEELAELSANPRCWLEAGGMLGLLLQCEHGVPVDGENFSIVGRC